MIPSCLVRSLVRTKRLKLPPKFWSKSPAAQTENTSTSVTSGRWTSKYIRSFSANHGSGSSSSQVPLPLLLRATAPVLPVTVRVAREWAAPLRFPAVPAARPWAEQTSKAAAASPTRSRTPARVRPSWPCQARRRGTRHRADARCGSRAASQAPASASAFSDR